MPIKIDPSLLMSQSAEMTHLTQEFDSLFSSVSSSLTRMNGQWSKNLANNFTPKILSTRGMFSSLTELLRGGAESAKTSASLFQSLDLSLEGSGALSGLSGKASGWLSSAGDQAKRIWEPTKREIDAFLENHGIHRPMTDGEPDTTVGLSGNAKKDIEKYYHDCFDEDSRIDQKWEYTDRTTGSSTEGRLFGDIYWEKTNDVRTYYGKYAAGTDYEAVNGQYKQIGQQILISEGTDTPIEIDLNALDYRGDVTYNPSQGSVYATGGVEYDVASVNAHLGETGRDPVVISMGAKAGVGVSGDVGIHNGVAKLRVSAAAGIGGEIGVEVDYGKIWGDVKSAFSKENLKDLMTIKF